MEHVRTTQEPTGERQMEQVAITRSAFLCQLQQQVLARVLTPHLCQDDVADEEQEHRTSSKSNVAAQLMTIHVEMKQPLIS